ncbi:uncharacterized protein VTP21DRAFT_1065 [Calcarisporiella thermophila]|uniref:uncharacterized protein n=1 Tax=Calcarisporiella thermophila TaxID=911321 RepID=UPI003744288E
MLRHALKPHLLHSHSRLYSTAPPTPSRTRRLIQFLWRHRNGIIITTASIATVSALVAGEKHPFSAALREVGGYPHVLCLTPAVFEPRGEKKLPVAEFFKYKLDDHEVVVEKDRKKKTLVILGSGWGAVSVLKTLDKDAYNVVLVSPTNYFCFTPLLPSVTVGTVEIRSILEPIRRITMWKNAHFIEGKARDVDFNEKLVEVEGSNGTSFYIPYDKLVIAVGSQSITHGVSGLEHCHFLKTVQDARKIRSKIMSNLEMASLPTTTPDERKRLLSFVICGGGPTGVEFAAELYDMISEDLIHYFPKLLSQHISISIIQSRDHILNTYDQKISEYAEKKFQRDHINVVTNARVNRVEEGKIFYEKKIPGSHETEIKEVPFGLCLWSTGITKTDFTNDLTTKFHGQRNSRAIEVDQYLRLLGVEVDSVYAIGDCATVAEPHFVDHLMEYLKEADVDNSGSLDYQEFAHLCETLSKRYPRARSHLLSVDRIFEEADYDKSRTISLEELRVLLEKLDKKITAFPATAQVAHQQGEYVGKRLNLLARYNDKLPDYKDEAFAYSHLGSLAYIGRAAVGDFGSWQVTGGMAAMYAWRASYWGQQASLRNMTLLSLDWLKKILFGRDVSKF